MVSGISMIDNLEQRMAALEQSHINLEQSLNQQLSGLNTNLSLILKTLLARNETNDDRYERFINRAMKWMVGMTAAVMTWATAVKVWL